MDRAWFVMTRRRPECWGPALTTAVNQNLPRWIAKGVNEFPTSRRIDQEQALSTDDASRFSFMIWEMPVLVFNRSIP